MKKITTTIIFSLYGLALFFFWLRVVSLATGTSILFHLVLDQENLGLVIVALGWLFAFFVIVTAVSSLRKYGEPAYFLNIHAKVTSRLFWVGIVILLMLLATASMGMVPAIILVSWSIIYVAVLVLLTLLQLKPLLGLPPILRQLMGLK